MTPINTEEALAPGKIFHKEEKIVITEKFINAEFLVPFPRYNFTLRHQKETLLHELSTKWITQSAFCNTTYKAPKIRYKNQTYEKFFLVADELAKVYKVQNETQENQNRNWNIVEEQFAIVDHNLNGKGTCMEMQATQQQLTFIFDTAASLLLTTYPDIKSYRAVLYSFELMLTILFQLYLINAFQSLWYCVNL